MQKTQKKQTKQLKKTLDYNLYITRCCNLFLYTFALIQFFSFSSNPLESSLYFPCVEKKERNKKKQEKHVLYYTPAGVH